MQKMVTITIDENGETNIDLTGFSGVGCASVMRDFTDGAGQIKREVKKREYAESDTAATRKTVVA
jgi:hypothetical protein